MKKVLTKCIIVILFVLFAIIILTNKAYAESNFQYEINESGNSVTITKYTGKEKEVVVPETIEGHVVTDIGKNCFYFNSSICSVTLPKTIVKIGDFAFCDCHNLVSVNVPNRVITIGNNAFKSCPKLTSIYIPANVKYIGVAVFSYCDSLSKIYVNDDNEKFTSVDGVLYNKDKTEIICYPKNKDGNEYEILNTVKTIGKNSFSGCDKLTKITIPNSVTTIDDYAFYFCKGLTEIELPESVTTLNRFAFGYCTELKNITIPDTTKNIDKAAFTGSKSITLECKEGSSAETFAKENQINYSIIKDYITGDLNKDGKITITDLLILKKDLVGIEKIKSEDKKRADINEDGKITITDLLILKKKLVGIE